MWAVCDVGKFSSVLKPTFRPNKRKTIFTKPSIVFAWNKFAFIFCGGNFFLSSLVASTATNNTTNLFIVYLELANSLPVHILRSGLVGHSDGPGHKMDYLSVNIPVELQRIYVCSIILGMHSKLNDLDVALFSFCSECPLWGHACIALLVQAFLVPILIIPWTKTIPE